MKFNPLTKHSTISSCTVLFWCVAFLAIFLPAQADNAWSESPPNVIQLLVDPVGGLMALTEDKAGLFFSSDGGKRWIQGKGLPETYLYTISSDAQKDLFLSTSSGVFCSINGGADWFPVGKLNSAFIAFAPAGASCLVKVWGKGLFKTSAEYFRGRGENHGGATAADDELKALKKRTAQPRESLGDGLLDRFRDCPTEPLQSVVFSHAGKRLLPDCSARVYTSPGMPASTGPKPTLAF